MSVLWMVAMAWQALLETEPALALVPAMLREAAEYREIKGGEVLFRLGESPRKIFYVITGEVRLLRRARNGDEIILQRSRSGFIAEASIDAVAYHCDGVATATGAVLCLPMRAFKATLFADNTFQHAWATHLARELRKLRARCERLSLKTAAERIIHYLEVEGMDGSIILDQSRKAWAAELGLTHEALYRALRRLEADRVLDIEPSRNSPRLSIC